MTIMMMIMIMVVMTVIMTAGVTYLKAGHNEVLSRLNVGEVNEGVQRCGVLPCPVPILLQEHLKLSTNSPRCHLLHLKLSTNSPRCQLLHLKLSTHSPRSHLLHLKLSTHSPVVTCYT